MGGAPPTVYVYDPMGQLAAEYGTTIDTSTGTHYLTTDALGSTRLTTDGAGVVPTCYDYLPFGQELTAGTDARPGPCFASAPDVLNVKFTSKERDAETGLDYFGARYLSSAQGRFTSPDPLLISARLENPQSWNRYSYALNNLLLQKTDS